MRGRCGRCGRCGTYEITPQIGVNLPEPSFSEVSLTFPYE
jgi:hypothetical protein